MSFIHKAALCAGIIVSAGTFAAETLYSVQSQSLNGRVLYDQEITDDGVVTLKPSVPVSAQGDVAVLAQCLWSVHVNISSGNAEFRPGKMVCVGPKQEVLETIPVGNFESFGTCVDRCRSFKATGDDEVIMDLEAPLNFTLQPRNETK